ncbi:perforin-1-like [Pseudophryne corroboree]|uniref:perforin-1-like n=1 Tax=Pseudophryne corroboree TaxID=495146 RepID=UPI003081DFED
MLLLSIIFIVFSQAWATTSPNLTTGCRPGTIAECSKALFVPGHTLLGEGLNILTMKPTGSFLMDMQKVDKECTLCHNPYENDVLQKLPKAMVDWRPQPSCPRKIVSSVYQSVLLLANEGTDAVSNDWKVGLEISAGSVGGSHSKIAKFAKSKIIYDKYNFLSNKLQCSYYSFGLSKEPALTKSFTDILQQLPASYNAGTKGKYIGLISHYGTHYITHAEVGGRAQEVTAVRTCEVVMDGMTMDEVKDCLSVEAGLSTSVPYSPSINTTVSHCSRKARKANRGTNYHQMFNEREWEVIGGNVKFDLFSSEIGRSEFDKWLEGLKTTPGLVTYSLDPIYNLVRFKGPQKDNLRRAINDYIKENALIINCSCPGRTYASRGGHCYCACQATKHINSDCCPTNRGAAKLLVSVEKARDLWGDYGSDTDAYVKVTFDSTVLITQTIWNNDDPQWNANYEMNIVDLAANKKITIEVWDEDNKHNDDLLGKCEETVKLGYESLICHLDHGRLTYSLSVRCLDHLGGDLCRDYRPDPGMNNPLVVEPLKTRVVFRDGINIIIINDEIPN